MWTIWIEQNNKVFDEEQCMNLKFKTSFEKSALSMANAFAIWEFNSSWGPGHGTSCATATNLGFRGIGEAWICNNLGLEDLWVGNSFLVISNLCGFRLNFDLG
jgi:hypothetical protein